MKTIVITMPEGVDREAERICRMLDSGEVDYLHLRKPSWDERAMELLIKDIPARLHPRLKLHSCYELLNDYAVGGVHLNSRHSVLPGQIINMRHDIKISRSCHSFEEIIRADRQGGLEYVTLSPVFTSISKPDYPANALLILEDIRDVLRRVKTPVIALGGVTPHKYPVLERLGYAGGALLGFAWNNLF